MFKIHLQFNHPNIIKYKGRHLRVGSRQSEGWLRGFQGAGNVHPVSFIQSSCNLSILNHKVRKKKKKPAEQRATTAPAEKKTTAPRLSNGFVCPGGKLGVRNIFLLTTFSSLPSHRRFTLLFRTQRTAGSFTLAWTGSPRGTRAARLARCSTRPLLRATIQPTLSAAKLTITNQSHADHQRHHQCPR